MLICLIYKPNNKNEKPKKQRKKRRKLTFNQKLTIISMFISILNIVTRVIAMIL